MSDNLTGQRVNETFGRLLQIANANDGADGTLRVVRDGKGDATPLYLSTTTFGVGAGSANYWTSAGATTGNPILFSAAGSDTHVGVGLVPKGDYMTTTTRMLIGPQASWAAAQTGNATRLRTQLAAFHTSFVHTSGQEFYPQFSVTGGSQSGTVDAGKRHGHSVMSIDNDNLVTVAGGSGPEGLSMLYIGLGAGNANGAAGGAHAGGRTAIDANIFVNSDVDIGAGTIFHVALAGNTTAYRRMGGVPGSHRGNVFGSLLAARGQNLGGTGPGPRYLNSIVSLEADVEQQANVSALWKMGIQIVEEKDSAANALQQNIGLGFINQPSATTIGWQQVISFSGYNGQFSAASNGQLIATTPSPIGLSSFATADGMNLARIAFSRAAIETPGFYVDGSGNLGGEKVGGLSLQTVSAVNAKVSTVSSITVVDGGVYDGPTLISTTATYSSGSTAVTVASFAGISNGMIIAGTDFTPGTTVVSGAGTVNLVVSANTLGAGTGAAVTFVTANPKPTFTIASPATSGGVSGTTATMTAATMGAVGFTGINTGGTGYVAGDVLTAVGGTGTAFTITVETVTSGQPTNIRVETAGSYTVLPTNPVSFTGGSGVNFSLGMRWTILTVSNTAGTNYNELRPPVVTYTGAMTQTREARFKLAMTAGTLSVLALNEGANIASGALVSYLRSNQTLGGNVSTSDNVYVNSINVADYANTTTGSGPAALNYFAVIDSLQSTATGGRNGLLSLMSLNGAMTNAANNLFYNAASFDANCRYNQGGTAAGGNYAKLVAFTGEASARAGATYMNSVEASEIGAGVRAGASAGFVHVFRISPLGYAGSRGGFWGYNGLVFAHGTATGTDGLGLDTAIGFGGADGDAWPVARTGNLLEIQTPNTAPTNTVAWGVDFGRGTFDGGAWRSPGTTIDGTGKIGGTTVYGNALQTAGTIKAATAVVGSIAVTNGGAFDAIPTLTIAASPGGGTTATATVASMKAARAFIDTQGSGYTNGDVLTVSGGTSTTAAQLTLTVSGGLITEITVSTAGSYTVLPTNAVSVTGGTGTGAKFYVQWGINAVTVSGAGTLYNTFPPPFIACSGEKSIKALFAVTMTETQQQLQLNNGKINVTGIPTSAAGLSSGDVWNNLGILTVV